MRKMFSENQIKKMAGDVAVSVIESGEVENAKPIYCHPVTWGDKVTGTFAFQVTMLIFNNDPTPFTYTSFVEWVKKLSKDNNIPARIMATGYYKDTPNSYIYPVSYLYVDERDETSPKVYQLIVSASQVENIVFDVNLASQPYQFSDGVNKIN